MDEEFLENDLDWFLSCGNGEIAHFATGGKGPVPEKIRESVAKYEAIYDYFYSLESLSDVKIIDKNLPEFLGDEQRVRYLKSFIEISQRGLYSFDYRNGEYKLIAIPQHPLKYSDLPDNIKNIIYVSSGDIASEE
ncbi:hypothetical protein [Kalamiella sp. sgz302252]|uniref:hypothetical protein n=1 Tax=Pantoea sp. sgz302252 TaxID=3341827 RepID=UPI0036D2E335